MTMPTDGFHPGHAMRALHVASVPATMPTLSLVVKVMTVMIAGAVSVGDDDSLGMGGTKAGSSGGDRD